MLSKECSAACRRSEEEGVPWGPSVPVVLLHRVCFFSHEQMMLWWSTSSAHKVEALEPETLEGQRYLTGIDSAWARCHLSNEDVLFGEMISSKSANLNRNVGQKVKLLITATGLYIVYIYIHIETCFIGIGIPEDLGWDFISYRLQVLKMPHKHSWQTEFCFDGTMMDSFPEICPRMGVLSLRMKTRNRRKRTKHHSQSTTMCLFWVWHTRTFGPSNLKKCFFVSVGVSFDRVVEVQMLLTFVNCKLLRCDF